MGYQPIPRPSRGQILLSLEEYDGLKRRRRSWWRTLLWCWALRRRGFWRDRHWRCELCGRAWPLGRSECSCKALGPYRAPGLVPATPSDSWVPRLVMTQNGRFVPELPDPLPLFRRSG